MAGQNVRKYPVHHTHPCISDEAPDPLELSQVTQSELLPKSQPEKAALWPLCYARYLYIYT